MLLLLLYDNCVLWRTSVLHLHGTNIVSSSPLHLEYDQTVEDIPEPPGCIHHTAEVEGRSPAGEGNRHNCAGKVGQPSMPVKTV